MVSFGGIMDKIIVLSNNDNAKPLVEWLANSQGYEVLLVHERIDLRFIEIHNPFFVISYNYRFIISEDIIKKMGNRIINLHISYLPWNRGSSPNFWSFIENTPKGVTIHRLEKGLDTGQIIAQKELFFDEEKETLSSTYSILNAEIIELLKNTWDDIKTGDYAMKPQTQTGSYHTISDLNNFLKNKTIDYGIKICELRQNLTSS